MRTSSSKHGRKSSKQVGRVPANLIEIVPTDDALQLDDIPLTVLDAIATPKATTGALPLLDNLISPPAPPPADSYIDLTTLTDADTDVGIIDLTGDELTEGLTARQLWATYIPHNAPGVTTEEAINLKKWALQIPNTTTDPENPYASTATREQLQGYTRTLEVYFAFADATDWTLAEVSHMQFLYNTAVIEEALLTAAASDEVETRPVPVVEAEAELADVNLKRAATTSAAEPAKKKRKPYTKKGSTQVTVIQPISPAAVARLQVVLPASADPCNHQRLTSDKWPQSEGHLVSEPVTASLNFYPPGDNSTLIEVYKAPSIVGVSIRQYVDKPYERRLNLGRGTFKVLHALCPEILAHYDRIEKDGQGGVTVTENYLAPLTATTSVLVNLYRGDAKIHLGTTSYINEMHKAAVTGRTSCSPSHSGFTITLNTLKDISERVGPALVRSLQFYN